MNLPLKRSEPVDGWRPRPSMLFPFVAGLVCGMLFQLPSARGQNGWTEPSAIRSVSGQFVVGAAPTYSPQLHRADLATNSDFVRLEPALLAVTAERFKTALWHELGLKPDTAWSGKIYLALRPARSVEDQVNIRISQLLNVWNYRVELPDVLRRTRFARALSGTLLLEIANRGNSDAKHSAEIPPWLTDGMAGLVLGGEPGKIILSAPSKKIGGIVLTRTTRQERGMDPLAAARRVLQDASALTFDQLSWPTGGQMDGDDGGTYLASAQVFVASLLELPNGPEKMRALLAQLPRCENWQPAFFVAFRDDFKTQLEVEKWWALRLLRFAAREPGARWTPALSRQRLAGLLRVPVEERHNADSLPEHKLISLQSAIWQLAPAARADVLRQRLRDLELAQLRLAQPFAGLARGYCAALAEFLGDGRNNLTSFSREAAIGPKHRTMDVGRVITQLDALDAQREKIEARMDAGPIKRLPGQVVR